MDEQKRTPENIANETRRLINELQAMGRADLLLGAIGVPLLEELRIEAERSRLSRLHITNDYRFLLTDYGNVEIDLSPIHKALYLLFLSHPEGIEFKRLIDHRQELLQYYMRTANRMDVDKIKETVIRLADPTDNAINEKCSRIKNAFMSVIDEYKASYYIISSHTKRHVEGSARIWYERLKVITLPRKLVTIDQ